MHQLGGCPGRRLPAGGIPACRCRLYGMPAGVVDRRVVNETLANISRDVLFVLSGVFPEKKELLFSCPDTVSGRFIQSYFNYLVTCKGDDGKA